MGRSEWEVTARISCSLRHTVHLQVEVRGEIGGVDHSIWSCGRMRGANSLGMGGLDQNNVLLVATTLGTIAGCIAGSLHLVHNTHIRNRQYVTPVQGLLTREGGLGSRYFANGLLVQGVEFCTWKAFCLSTSAAHTFLLTKQVQATRE